MKELTIPEIYAITGGADTITVADVSIPTTGLSAKCVPVLETLLQQMKDGNLSKDAADNIIANEGCQKDYAKLIRNFQASYYINS